MGFISDYAGAKAFNRTVERFRDNEPLRVDNNRGWKPLTWRGVFGPPGYHERMQEQEERKKKPVPGGSWGRSSLASEAAMARLLEAMRSMAPGGWSDDRWEQAARHFVSIAYVAIHRICVQWQRAEFQVFHKDPSHPEGKRPVEPNDPPQGERVCRPYDLVKLLERPNRQDSFGKMLYRLGQQKYLTGTALNWLVPNKLGTPYEMYVIPTAIAIPQPTINPEFPDGYYRIQPIYPYGPFSTYPTPASAVGAPIPAQWVMRFQFPHALLRYEGHSPLTALRLELDEVESINRSRWYSMKRSVNPSVVVNFPEMDGAQPLPEQEIERIRSQWEADFQGPENHGRMIVGAPGSELEILGQRPVDMDYSTGWQQLTDFCLAGFGITKPAAGMVDGSSYSVLYAALKQLYWLTLDPDLEDVGSEFTRHLAPYFGDDLIVEVRTKPIDDHDIKLAKLRELVQAKALTINELRLELDMSVTQEEWGEERVGAEPQQQGMPGMPGMPGMEQGMPGGGAPDLAALTGEKPLNGQANGAPTPPTLPEEEREEPEEVMATRPRPGKLGRGALGPRGALANGKNRF